MKRPMVWIDEAMGLGWKEIFETLDTLEGDGPYSLPEYKMWRHPVIIDDPEPLYKDFDVREDSNKVVDVGWVIQGDCPPGTYGYISGPVLEQGDLLGEEVEVFQIEGDFYDVINYILGEDGTETYILKKRESADDCEA